MGFENKFRKIKNFVDELWGRYKRFNIGRSKKGCLVGCEEFKYLGLKIDKEDRQENNVKNRINKGRAITSMLWNIHLTRKRNYKHITVKSTLTYGAETWKFIKFRIKT